MPGDSQPSADVTHAEFRHGAASPQSRYRHALRAPALDEPAPVQGVGQGRSDGRSQPRRSDHDPEGAINLKKQGRLVGPGLKPVKSQMFYFVDSNSSSREKRAHVMRHHVQEKRKQRKHCKHGAETEHPIRPLRCLPWQQKQFGLDAVDSEDVGPEQVQADLDDESLASSGPSSLSPPSHPSKIPHLESPLTMLDASRKDPFRSLPMESSPENAVLVDYWTNRLTYWSGQNKYIKDQIFRSAMCHPLAFQAVILSYCSRWRSHLHHLEDGDHVHNHHRQVVTGIDKVMNGSLPMDADHLGMTLSGLALQEERFGDRQASRGYEDQAVQMLRSRGGSSKIHEVILHFVRYLLMPSESSISPEGQQWLGTFLRGAEQLMSAQSSDAYLTSVPQRRAAFGMDSPLFPLLSSGPHPTQVPLDSRVYVVQGVPTQEVMRTAALIYITAALWDFQDHPGKTARFLDHIQKAAKSHSLDRTPACETFTWLLLEESYEADLKDPERGWSTGELLKVHKQLRPDLQFHFNEILFSFLALTPPIRGIDAFESELCASSGPDDLDDV
ncbi:hypothetical protein P168DRAFT_319203 [Aspergillus campestris IBT 28561]|uniref:Uncharacterized protein n=1 Tax=Aspergillus campestris (strain IBT 28561) TaxID=1392248 RepID=A0A2I1D1J2_ASPC2|nr:uncharacterized protein P168DRAFT_319203 [Aspergillus campestris IBT 28561]PKY03743.1 hypothetical protein P168DRAFT_319203 [Aspergillus campestris IBT 28561]